MKAIQISGLRQMQIVNVPEQELHADEVLLRLQYVGFCGSDLSTYLGKNPMVKMPVIPGHEIGAVIEKVGADVPEDRRAHHRVSGLAENQARNRQSHRRDLLAQLHGAGHRKHQVPRGRCQEAARQEQAPLRTP